MEITATKTFNFRPIGNVRFTFSRSVANRRSAKHTYIHVNDISIFHDTDVDITEAQEKELLKFMKVSDLLLDSRTGKYYTTRGTKLTQITFPQIRTLNHEEDL